MDLPVVPLHKHPEYTTQCCELINEEWKGPITARLRMVECSCDALPTSLILLKHNVVIGHCRLSVIPNQSNTCFVDLVVICKSLRGKGYGRYLMINAEEYCTNTLNLKAIYLATRGQELFYSKLGYNKCEPIFTTKTTSTTTAKNNSERTDNENKSPTPSSTVNSATSYVTMKKILVPLQKG